MRRLVAALLGGLCLSAEAASELITLNYISPEQALPLVQSVLQEQGTVKAHGNHLLVNASAFRLREVRSLIDQLDKAPKQLVISVDTQAHTGLNTGHSKRYSTEREQGRFQQIRVLEGHAAQIQLGQSIAKDHYSVGPYGEVQSQTQYRELTQGFLLTAHVIGENAQINLSSFNDQLDPTQRDAVLSQNVQSTLSAPLGEWINVAYSANQARLGNYSQRYSTERGETYQVRIKVELQAQ